MNKNVIICHGDGDGIISAASIARLLGRETMTIITQPFLLGKVVIPEDITNIYVVDIAVNNKDVQMTRDFASTHADKIVIWADHHQGTDILADIIGKKLVFDDTEPSCPSLLLKAGYSVPKKWVDAANASDRPTDFPATDLSTRYNHAFKAALVEAQEGNRTIVEEIQQNFITELRLDSNGQCKSDIVSKYVEKYQEVKEATTMAADSIEELIPGVGVITLGEKRVDKTGLCLASYKKHPIVVIHFISPENGEMVTMVATNREDLNLVEVFGLPSGPPFRILLNGDFEESKKLIIEKLK